MKNALLRGFKAFFDIRAEEEKETLKKVGLRVSVLTVGRIVYSWLDWIIAGGLASFSFWMQTVGFNDVQIYLGTFLYDFFAAAFFFFLSDMTNCDFTFGQSFRRVADSFAKEGFWGKIFSGVFLVGLSFKAIVWEGPETICFLFKKELKTRSNIWLALFLLSALQGIFGTWLYKTGYRLWQEFGSSVLGSHYILAGVATFVAFIIIVAVLRKLSQWVIAAVRFFQRRGI
jgi:hypothetical protein